MQHVLRMKSNRLQKLMKLKYPRQKNYLIFASLYVLDKLPCESESEVPNVVVYFKFNGMFHFIYYIIKKHTSRNNFCCNYPPKESSLKNSTRGPFGSSASFLPCLIKFTEVSRYLRNIFFAEIPLTLKIEVKFVST